MLPKETVGMGASVEACEFCGQTPTLGVYSSAAGYYVGYACCMPYSRESGYYRTYDAAELAMTLRDFGRVVERH